MCAAGTGTETQTALYVSMHCAVALEKSTALSV